MMLRCVRCGFERERSEFEGPLLCPKILSNAELKKLGLPEVELPPHLAELGGVKAGGAECGGKMKRVYQHRRIPWPKPPKPAYAHLDVSGVKGGRKRMKRFVVKLAPGVYQGANKDGTLSEEMWAIHAPPNLVADPAAQAMGIVEHQVIDPQQWPLGIVELEAELVDGKLRIKEKQKCRCCGGDARECYPRHAIGRSCA